MIHEVLALVDRASAAIMEVYRSNDFEPTLKGDASPLTRADLVSSQILVDGLEHFSGIRVVSEERELSWSERKGLERFWLVDPLDGTKDFLKRDDEFTVNVALVEAGQPVLGVVAAPALQQTFFATRGEGAFRRDQRGVVPIRYVASRSTPVATDSRLHSSPEISDFCRRNGITTVIPCGSAIKVCRVAEGAVDVYPRFGPTMEWDVAASQVIAEEGGCEVLAMTTRGSLRYNKEEMTNPPFIVMPLGAAFSW